jgi:DNA excision repair protein ERCC-3
MHNRRAEDGAAGMSETGTFSAPGSAASTRNSSDAAAHAAAGDEHHPVECMDMSRPRLLKPDHQSRPLWIDPSRKLIVLERFSPLAEQATDFLVTVAEPRSRPALLHEYALTEHSLYAAASVGLGPRDIIDTLNRFLKTELPASARDFILSCAKSNGKAKLVLKNNKYFVESTDPEVLQSLLKDTVISKVGASTKDLLIAAALNCDGLVILGTKDAVALKQANLLKQSSNPKQDQVFSALTEDDNDNDGDAVHAFEIVNGSVEVVQKWCLELVPEPQRVDFHADHANPDLGKKRQMAQLKETSGGGSMMSLGNLMRGSDAPKD